ncbi:hypothetical protein [Colwellia sp. TT2012]|uniref:hypothetical protein n=1 Tax=Colwellia sp. TT2012 TaxID=1720342 RepID=UPI00070C7623|nr:hypothetical protein [Colwellia sp. TT2012]
MITNFSSQITRYGVSESFNAFIDGLRETPGIFDKKFRLADVNKMTQYLVCRNYGKACLELSYLAWAIVNYPTNYSANAAVGTSVKTLANAPLLEFFWLNESITPSRFRHAFKSPYKNNNIEIALNKAGLQLTVSQQSFVISPTRVGLLAVLFEIIISLAPEQLTVIEQTLKQSSDAKPDVTAIKKLSSVLQKQIYQFLAEHLVPAQQQRRFRYISQWLTSKKQNSAHIYALTDDTILSFWQHAGLDDLSPGYKLYASAFNDMVATHQAMQHAKEALALANASTIGFNIEAGEYSPDIIEEILFNKSSDSQDYAWLCQTPKFLTKAQWRFLEPLMQKQAYVKKLPLSFARLAIFGQWQASIVQAKRKSPLILQEKLTEIPEKNYLLYQQQLSKQTELLTQVILAIAHIFYNHQDSRYLGCILDFIPKATTQKIKSHLDEKIDFIGHEQNPQALTTEVLNKALFSQSQTLLRQSLELSRIMQAAKSAFNSNNKEGFQHLPPLELLDIYQDGYDAIARCQHIIQIYLSQLSKYWLTTDDCQLNYGSDVSIFKDMFDRLYGEVNDQ